MINQEVEDNNEKKRIIAFKSLNQEDSMKVEESGDENEDISLMTRKFSKHDEEEEARKKKESFG